MLDSVGNSPSLFALTQVDTRSGGRTQRCAFSDDRFLEATEKLQVQTREPTDDILAVALCKMGLEKSSRGHIKGSRGIHTRNKFSRSGIWRIMVSLSSCTKYEAKKAKKKQRQQHTFTNIKLSELPAPQSH